MSFPDSDTPVRSISEIGHPTSYSTKEDLQLY